jgi:alpha-beta hydrolase superfamily lysophospholipase
MNVQVKSASHTAPIVVHHRFATIDGLKIFYREAGPADAPVVLLLHGFPTSSHMFRNLIPQLAVLGPDQGLLERRYEGEPGRAARPGHPGDDDLPVHRRR